MPGWKPLSASPLRNFSPASAPRVRIPEGQGGQIWTYIEETQGMQSAPMSRGSLQGYGGGSTARSAGFTSTGFTSRKEFFIDSSGTIYKYRGTAD
jgi:hypothetical protein